MGIPVLILGESGSGKTYSIKNFEKNEVGVFLVEKTRLPFKKDFKIVKNATYSTIMKALASPTLKKYVIDDSQYLLVNEMFDRAKEVGYNKFTDIALNFRNLIHYINQKLPDDIIVYFLHHTEIDNTSIEFTIYDTERVTFDLIEIMNENFGWTEGTDTSYTVFLDYRSWVSFILYEEYVAVETETSGMNNTMTLRVS